MRTDPLLRKAARTHKPVEGEPAGGERNAYITPMRLLGRRVLFAEYRSSDALKAGVASFRDSLGLFVLLSLLIALPLFYVLGGRSVGVLYRAALQRARRDGLTDLDNHRAFQDELSRAVGEATRYDSDVTLALLDIDDFKFENDRHGHQHGDRLLCELAELLREQPRRRPRLPPRRRRVRRPARPHARVRRRRAARAHPRRGRAPPVRRDHQHRLQRRTPRGPRAEHAVGPRRRRAARGQAPWRQRGRRLHRGRRQRPGRDDREGPRGPLADRRGRGRRRLPADLGPRRHARARVRGARAAALVASSPDPARRSRSPTRSAAATSSTPSAAAPRCALASELPDGALLFLNVSPQTLEHDGLAGDSLVLAVRGAGYEPHQVVLEITERTDARKELLLPEAARLRRLGFKLALDDVGAGNAGLEMLSALPGRLHQDRPRGRGQRGRGPRGARGDARHHGLRPRERRVRDRRGDRDRGDARARPRPGPGARGAPGRRPRRPGLPARPARRRCRRRCRATRRRWPP